MRIYSEVSLSNFDAWSGAVDTMETLRQLEDVTGRYIFDELESIMESSNDDWDETAVNDFLWFENDTIADWLGFSDWEELERVANEEEDEDEDEIELEYAEGDIVELANGIVAEIIRVDKDDSEFPYLVAFMDENDNRVDEWEEAEEIDHKIN